jgi:lipoyl(octanoyl) transferase
MDFINLGRTSYQDALKIQEYRHHQVATGCLPEAVYFLEHPHILTMGRRTYPGNCLTLHGPEGLPLELVRTNRGGDITYHGPGQLIGYPILDLKRRGNDLHRYLRNLEICLMKALSDIEVESFQRKGFTGVWTSKGKIASIGIGVRRWTTLHGFALNICTDLRYFDLINPCGISECKMVSLTEILGQPVTVAEFIPIVQQHLRATLQCDDVTQHQNQVSSGLPTVPIKQPA